MRMPPARKQDGFTLTELLVVCAVIAVFGAIGVSLFAPAFRTTEFSKAVDTLVSDIETRSRRAATTGREVTYSPSTELLRDEIVTINKGRIPQPPGYAVVSELRFEAATGKTIGPDGTPAATAIIISCEGDPEPQIAAVCINRSGIVTTLRYLNSSWSTP